MIRRIAGSRGSKAENNANNGGNPMQDRFEQYLESSGAKKVVNDAFNSADRRVGELQDKMDKAVVDFARSAKSADHKGHRVQASIYTP